VDYVLTTLTCKVVYKPTGYIWVDINSPCGSSACTGPYDVALVFSNLQNPSTFAANTATSSFGVYTMNSAKEYIDGVGTGVTAYPSLIGKTAIIKSIEQGDTVV